MSAATFKNELIFSIHLKAIVLLLTLETEPGFRQFTSLRKIKIRQIRWKKLTIFAIDFIDYGLIKNRREKSADKHVGIYFPVLGCWIVTPFSSFKLQFFYFNISPHSSKLANFDWQHF